MVALPEDGALSGIVNKNKCLLAGATCSSKEMRLDAELRKFRAVHSAAPSSPTFPYITRSRSPLLAGDHRGRYLAARQASQSELHLRTQRRMMRERNHGVGGVQSHTDDINLDESVIPPRPSRVFDVN